jgi:hypothetical protein
MEDFYPGSKRTRKQYSDEPLPPISDEEKLDLGRSKKYLVGNEIVELYPIGAIAAALNRKPVTVRKWETEGVIPVSPFMMKSHDARGQRRLYSREQIEALRKVAAEEGVLEPSAGGKWKPIEQTNFREKALKAFKGGK